MKAKNFKPDGYHTVTPYLVVKNADKLLDFAKQAFGAEETVRMPNPDGTIGHAEMRIGDSMVMLAEASEEHPANSSMLHLYVADVDKVFQKAINAGATVEREVADQFYGDRTGGLTDICGVKWYVATHIEDLTPEEMTARAPA